MVDHRIWNKSKPLIGFLPNPFSLLALLFLGAAVSRILKNEKRVIAKECAKCGKAFCKKCQPNTKISGFCIQCLHIFVRKDGVSPASRKEKMEEIEKHSRRQRIFLRLSSFVVPGMASLLQNRTVKGMLLLLPWLFLVSVLGYTWKYAGAFFFEPTGSLPIVMIVCFSSWR